MTRNSSRRGDLRAGSLGKEGKPHEGRVKPQGGHPSGRRKLTDEQAGKVKRALRFGSISDVASQFHLDPSIVAAIYKGISYVNVKEADE